MELVTELKGFSGCKIFLYKDRNTFLVRKISKSKDYNNRIKKQIDKQIFFYEKLANDKVTTPKVISYGEIDGLTYFDMEYINGRTLIEDIQKADNQRVNLIGDFIINLIGLIKKTTLGGKEFLSDKVIEKIRSVESEKYQFVDLKIKASLLPIVDKTFCHGDLTLENIIYDFDNDKYYLIDFLDNFADYYWFDIAKLFQDIEGEWYNRNKNINIKIKMDYIGKMIKDSLMGDGYLEFHSLLLQLTFIRILPYVKDKKEEEFILERIR